MITRILIGYDGSERGDDALALGRTLAGEFDVIVLGASHRGALGRIWPGSATEQTLHGAPRPVAVAPPGYAVAHPLGTPLARIGVGYDGSAEARRALELAAGLALGADAGAPAGAVAVADATVPADDVAAAAAIAGADATAPADAVARA